VPDGASKFVRSILMHNLFERLGLLSPLLTLTLTVSVSDLRFLVGRSLELGMDGASPFRFNEDIEVQMIGKVIGYEYILGVLWLVAPL